MVGPALDSLKAVLESEGQNSIDLVFIGKHSSRQVWAVKLVPALAPK
jgi:hypothetical protein